MVAAPLCASAQGLDAPIKTAAASVVAAPAATTDGSLKTVAGHALDHGQQALRQAVSPAVASLSTRLANDSEPTSTAAMALVGIGFIALGLVLAPRRRDPAVEAR